MAHPCSVMLATIDRIWSFTAVMQRPILPVVSRRKAMNTRCIAAMRRTAAEAPIEARAVTVFRTLRSRGPTSLAHRAVPTVELASSTSSAIAARPRISGVKIFTRLALGTFVTGTYGFGAALVLVRVPSSASGGGDPAGPLARAALHTEHNLSSLRD